MTGDSALWADAQSLQCLLLRLARSLRDKFGSFVDSLDEVFLLLELGELGADETENRTLVLGQVSEGFEASSAFGVVFEVVAVDVELVEQHDGDAVVASLTKVHAVLEVSSAQVDSNSHVFGNVPNTIVVELDVGVEDRLGFYSLLLHTREHGFRAEVSEERVVELDVSASSVVEVGEFFTVRFCEIGEIVLLVGVDRVISRVFTVSEVVPFGSGESELSRSEQRSEAEIIGSK
jgi:hypothetical protein